MYAHSSSPLLILAETDWRGIHRRFGLLAPDRLRHLWVVGKTGSGKSTLLLNLIAQDLQAGRGLALLDPHGDLAAAALSLVPRSRTNDVAYLDPADDTAAVAFNVLRTGRTQLDAALVASGLVAAFRKHWADCWGPRLEHVLRSAILAVLPHPKATLLLLYRFLNDEALRARMGPRIADPVVRAFWIREFPSYRAALQAEALSPVLNKLGAFVTNRRIRRIVSQPRGKLDLSDLIERRGILICNLSVGQVGEDASRLLGSLLLTSLQLAAMRRPTAEPPLHLYIDEFQHFVTESLSTMLSEARKFGLGLTLSHQYLAQLPPGLLAALRGNVGSMVVMRLGAEDARVLQAELDPPFSAEDLTAIPAAHAAMKVIVRGQPTAAFSARLLPPLPEPVDRLVRINAIREQSRRRFSTPVSEVDCLVEQTLSEPNTADN